MEICDILGSYKERVSRKTGLLPDIQEAMILKKDQLIIDVTNPGSNIANSWSIFWNRKKSEMIIKPYGSSAVFVGITDEANAKAFADRIDNLFLKNQSLGGKNVLSKDPKRRYFFSEDELLDIILLIVNDIHSYFKIINSGKLHTLNSGEFEVKLWK